MSEQGTTTPQPDQQAQPVAEVLNRMGKLESGLEQLMNALASSQQIREVLAQKPVDTPKTTPTSQQQTTPDQLLEQVMAKLAEAKAKEAAQANMERAKQELANRFEGGADKGLEELSKATGTSKEQLMELAGKSYGVFEKLLPAPKQPASSPSGSITQMPGQTAHESGQQQSQNLTIFGEMTTEQRVQNYKAALADFVAKRNANR